jgi:hypothetical protein
MSTLKAYTTHNPLKSKNYTQEENNPKMSSKEIQHRQKLIGKAFR